MTKYDFYASREAAVAIEGDIPDALSNLVGSQVVSVTSVGISRSTFDTQTTIRGVLEKHPAEDSYRVLGSDSSYCYFSGDDVVLIYPHQDCGPVIFLRIDPDYDEVLEMVREHKQNKKKKNKNKKGK